MNEQKRKGEENWAQKAARAFAQDDFVPEEQNNNTDGGKKKVPMRPHIVFPNPVPYLPDESQRNAVTARINQEAAELCQNLDMSKFKTHSVVEHFGGKWGRPGGKIFVVQGGEKVTPYEHDPKLDGGTLEEMNKHLETDAQYVSRLKEIIEKIRSVEKRLKDKRSLPNDRDKFHLELCPSAWILKLTGFLLQGGQQQQAFFERHLSPSDQKHYSSHREEFRELYAKYKREGGRLTIVEWLSFGVPIEAMTQATISCGFKVVGTWAEVRDIETLRNKKFAEVPEMTIEDIKKA